MFKLEFDTENSAFSENGLNEETAIILETIASRIRSGRTYGKAMDSNGNSIGLWELTEASNA